MPSLIKISDNEYRISGCVEARYEDVKTVTVEGVKYSRTDYIEKVFSYDDDFDSHKKSKWWRKKIVNDLTFLGMPEIVVWDYQWLHKTGIDSIAPLDCCYSSGSVNILMYLFHLGILDTRIRDVYTSKKQAWQTHLDEDKQTISFLYDHQEVDVFIRDYGFQNSYYCRISISAFFNLDMSIFKGNKYRALHKVIPEILATKKYMSEKTKLIALFRLFESQIKYIENENTN